MNRFFLKGIACSAALYVSCLLFPSIRMSHLLIPLLAGFVLAVLMISLRPLLILILSPLVLITAGFFALVINAWMILLTGLIVWHQYQLPSFWLTLLVACIVTVFDIGSQKLYNKEWIRD